MKKTFFLVLLVIALACGQAQAANYYFDLANGNDSTGDGSAGNPWKTIDKCTTSKSAGDECRGAKTAITTLSGTLTFTNGSTTVNTSNDQTGIVAAGDIIGKNSGLEGWWAVSSVGSSSITLTSQYWGISGSGSPVAGYKITPVTASEEYDVNSSGTAGNLIKISGGWDLTGPAQDGITAVYSTYLNTLDINGKNYVEVEKFILIKNLSNVNLVNSGCQYNKLHDIWSVDGPFYLYGGWSEYYNLVQSGGTANGFTAYGGAPSLLRDSYSFSAGTGISDYGLALSGAACWVFDTVKIYNSYYPALNTGGESTGHFFKNCIFDTIRSGSYLVSLGDFNIRFHGCNFANPPAYTFLGTAALDNIFIDCTITAGSSGLISINRTGQDQSLTPTITVKSSGADAIQYFAGAQVKHDSSAECRSGKCIKISPLASDNYPVMVKVGNVKVPSSGSNLTLKVYLKDDASHNGAVQLRVVQNAKWISNTMPTVTTSWAQQSIVVSSSDLVVGEYLDLYAIVTGSAGSVYFDDFSAEQ